MNENDQVKDASLPTLETNITDGVDYNALGEFVEDEMSEEDLAALFAGLLKVDPLERGANGWKFTEEERTILGKAQSAARLAGL